MTVSKSQSKARDKWDKEHLKTGSYKMDIEIYKIFEKYCDDNNYSKNGLINELIKSRLVESGYILNNEKN